MKGALKFPATEMWEETDCDARAAATMKLRHAMVAAAAFQFKPPWACMKTPKKELRWAMRLWPRTRTDTSDVGTSRVRDVNLSHL